MSDEAWVGLAEAIGQLRHELETAQLSNPNPEFRFEVGPVELEFTVDMRKSGGADAGVRWGVVSFGAKGELAVQNGHRLKLVLQPKDSRTGRNAEVTSTRVTPPPVN